MARNRYGQTFAALLYQHRRAAAMTQEELAQRAGVSRRDISELERGRIRRPHMDTITRLAAALSLTAGDLEVFQQTARRLAETPPTTSDEGVPQTRLLAQGTIGASVPFIGRRHDLAHVAQILEGDSPTVALITGEAGIGKSRLLYELGQRATGWRILLGICGRRHTPEPYAPWPSLLRRAIASTPAAQRAEELHGCAWLSRLAPDLVELGRLSPPAPTATEYERRLMLTALRRYLTQAAGPAGTLVLLDDLQWASPAALDLLADLWEEADPSPPLRLAVAFRPDAPAPLRQWVAECERRLRIRPLRLHPLPPDDARALLEQAIMQPSASAAETTWQDLALQRAAGNPFYVVSYAQEWRLLTSTSEMPDVPLAIAEAIRARLLALPLFVQRVLAFLAVADAHLTIETLARAAERSAEQVLAALERAASAEIVVQQGESFRFAHEITRDVLIRDLSVPRRRTLHRRLAEALEQSEQHERAGRAAALAFHFAEAGANERAMPYAILAGDKAEAVFAHTDAERWYRQALTIAQQQADQLAAARIATKIGGVLVLTGNFAEAITLLQGSLADVRAIDDGEGLYHAAMQILLYYVLTDPAKGIDHFAPMVDYVRAHLTPAWLADVYAYYANCYLFAARYREAQSIADQSLALAAEADAPLALTRAKYALGLALLWQGKTVEAHAHLQEATAQFLQHRDTIFYGNALNGLRENAFYRGDFATAQRILTELGDLSVGWGLPRSNFYYSYQAGIFAWYQGDWANARRSLITSKEIVQDTFPERWPRAWLALLDQLEGDETAANTHMAAARHWLQVGPAIRFDHESLAALAQIYLWQGRHDTIVTLLLPVVPDDDALTDLDHVPLLTLLAEAQLALGEVTAASTLIERAIRHARSMPHAPALLDALRVRALMALGQGQWASAQDDLAEALASACAMPYPYAQAQILKVTGDLYLARGERAIARTHWRTAAAICRHLGERAVRRQVVALLKDTQSG